MISSWWFAIKQLISSYLAHNICFCMLSKILSVSVSQQILYYLDVSFEDNKSTLTFEKLTVKNSGNYRCEATTNFHSKSTSVSLDVQYECVPEIEYKVSSREILGLLQNLWCTQFDVASTFLAALYSHCTGSVASAP